MKRYSIRSLAAFLVAVILLLSFGGCGEQKPSEKVEISYIQGNYPMIVDSVDKINCDYLLVYRNQANYNEVDSFVKFLEKLSAASSKSFQICPDLLPITDPNQKIILLGNTLYNESAEATSIMESIRSDNYYDYLINGYKNTLTVSWISKFGREDAFEYILNTLMGDNIDKMFAPEYSYLYLSDRTDLPVVTIDDINITQYSVVLPSAPSYIERSTAENLVKTIEYATGVKIPLVTDVADESRYEILIGDTNRGETYVSSFFNDKRYVVAQYSTKLILRGGQIEATAKAVSDFTALVKKASATAEPLHLKAGYCNVGNIQTYGGKYFNGYELVFSDEFNTKNLDYNKWFVENGAITTYGEASSLMFFKPENIISDTATMSIRTRLGSEGYMSGHVTSQNSFSMKYGYVEMKAKFRAAPGVWLKFMLCNQNDNKEMISQIDVFNSLGSNDTIFASAGSLEANTYYSNYLKLNEPSYECFRSGTFNDGRILNDEEYHTYGVEWAPNRITYYIDGQAYGVVEIGSDKYKELNTEMYLDMIAGVNLTEQVAVDEVAMWPIDFTVDWIRVYQDDQGTFTDRTLLPDIPPAGPENPDKKTTEQK